MTQGGEWVGLMIDGRPDFLYTYIGDRPPTLEQDQRSQIVVF